MPGTAPDCPDTLQELRVALADVTAACVRAISISDRMLPSRELAVSQEPPDGPPILDLSGLSPSQRKARLEAWARQAAERNDALAKAGNLKVIEFTADSPAEAAAGRLKRIARERGISPAAVNRVFKRPDRSKVATLRKIAAAMGVALHELI